MMILLNIVLAIVLVLVGYCICVFRVVRCMSDEWRKLNEYNDENISFFKNITQNITRVLKKLVFMRF